MYENFAPPSHPPPLLDHAQIASLIADGFVTLPVPQHMIDAYTSLFAKAKPFFSLPIAEKCTLFPSRPQSTEQGYTVVQDEKQYLTVRHAEGVASGTFDARPLKQAITDTWQSAAALLYQALHDVGAEIGIPFQAWEQLLKDTSSLPPSAEQSTPSLLRIFQYLPDRGVADAHKDLGLLTLCIGAGKGLQVKAEIPTASTHVGVEQNSVADWRDAAEVTLLAGDTLRILSSGRIASGIHRVVANPLGRSSIVFALRGNTGSVVDLSLFGGSGTILAAELWNMIKHNRVNVNASKESRVEQRRKNELDARKRSVAATSTSNMPSFKATEDADVVFQD